MIGNRKIENILIEISKLEIIIEKLYKPDKKSHFSHSVVN